MGGSDCSKNIKIVLLKQLKNVFKINIMNMIKELWTMLDFYKKDYKKFLYYILILAILIPVFIFILDKKEKLNL